MKFLIHFKEKVRDGDEWDTLDIWSSEIEAPDVSTALTLGAEQCREFEKQDAELGNEIQVSCEVELPK